MSNVLRLGCLLSILMFLSSPRASASWGLVQSRSAQCDAGNGQHSCSVTLNPIGSDHLLVAMFSPGGTSGAGAFSSMSCNAVGCGSWVHPPSCAWNNPKDSTVDCAYVLSSSVGATTVTVTFAGPGTVFYERLAVMEYSHSYPVLLDATGGTSSDFGGTAVAGVPLQLGGANDVVIQQVHSVGNPKAITNPYTAPADFSQPNSGFAASINTKSRTAPVWTDSTSAHRTLNAIAFTETAQVSTLSVPAAGGPLVQYTDLLSGPNSGGEGNNGSYLTIYGKNFGATQGSSTVTINGVQVAQYLSWSSTKIGVQVGAVSTGPIVVTVNGSASNSDHTFTVRTGHIYYVGPTVDNTAPPSCALLKTANLYSTPWGLTNFQSTTETAYNYTKMRTPETYYECMLAGDTLVFLDGTSYTMYDGRQWHASLTAIDNGGTSGNPITIMARPGARVVLGGGGIPGATNVPIYGIRINTNYLVISGLFLTSNSATGVALEAAGLASRFVGNELTCPACNVPSAVLDHPGGGSVVFGNYIHDASTLLTTGSSKLYHGIYFAANNIEVAYNKIANTRVYNGIQVHQDSASGFYNISIHDNDVADVNGSGINLSTIDPASGYILVYNNLVHHVGMAIAMSGSGGDPHSCIAFKGYGTAGGIGTAYVYANTMLDCSGQLNHASNSGEAAIFDSGKQTNVTRRYVDNIIYQPSYTYGGANNANVFINGGITSVQQPILMAGSSNTVFFFAGTALSTNNAGLFGVISDPLFVSTTDFHLRAGSPAISTGITFQSLTKDFDGGTRLLPPSIGVYEYVCCQN